MSKDATRIYSTCFSVVSDGYCDLNFLVDRDTPLRLGGGCVEEGVEEARELLLADPRCGKGGAVVVAFRAEWFDGVRVEGKEDKEV